jgi:hypothetical protein
MPPDHAARAICSTSFATYFQQASKFFHLIPRRDSNQRHSVLAAETIPPDHAARSSTSIFNFGLGMSQVVLVSFRFGWQIC